MPIDIHGWIEITRHDEPERSEEYAWSAVLSVAALIDVGDMVSHRLFGIGLKKPPPLEAVAPIAAGRGLPRFPSGAVTSEIAAIQSLERRLGYSEFAGYTFATWRELSTADLSAADVRASDWHVVFDLLRRLSDDPRLGPDKIRCVVWYSI